MNSDNGNEELYRNVNQNEFISQINSDLKCFNNYKMSLFYYLVIDLNFYFIEMRILMLHQNLNQVQLEYLF